MNIQEQKGREIAALSKLVQKNGTWYVPSQTGDGTRYRVKPAEQVCSCPDHEINGTKCKHIYAVEFTVKREFSSNGRVKETKTMRVTYRQDWPAYNAAQTEEKTRFMALLADLCNLVAEPDQPRGKGRPRLPLSIMAFVSVFKVYIGFSSRRYISDLREARNKGYISEAPHFNSVSNALGNADLTPVLKSLVTVSSLPLKDIETDFAVDSSGFSTSRFVRWYNKKWGRELDNREWVKVHMMCGVKTHIVTSVEVSGWAANDSPYFIPLVERTAQHFQMIGAEISADKAYVGHHNMDAVDRLGATPFIPFRSNTIVPTDDSTWTRMYHWFMFNRESFLASYHKRSNSETVFSMIKAKFGDSLRSKSDTAQVNEVLCKVLCHNICVLIQSMHELGIEPDFRTINTPVAQEIPVLR